MIARPLSEDALAELDSDSVKEVGYVLQRLVRRINSLEQIVAALVLALTVEDEPQINLAQGYVTDWALDAFQFEALRLNLAQYVHPQSPVSVVESSGEIASSPQSRSDKLF